MFTKKRKMESNSGVVKPEDQLLRLFRSGDVFQGSLISQEDTNLDNVHNEDQRLIRNANLEAECQRARALLAFQNNKRFY